MVTVWIWIGNLNISSIEMCVTHVSLHCIDLQMESLSEFFELFLIQFVIHSVKIRQVQWSDFET